MGRFTPHVVLRNLTATAQTVTLTLEYPQGSLAEKATKATENGKESGKYREFDGESGEGTGQLTLPPLVIPAHSVEDQSLLPVLGQLPLPLAYASVRIQYTGAAGGVIAEVASVDESNDLVVDSHVVNEGWGWAGSGANPFHLDDQTESILFLTDMGDKPVRMGFFVTVDGVNQVLTQLNLDPHETRAINLRKLRDTQRADFKGHRIRADASDGTVTWLCLSSVPVAGRVVVINRHSGTASNYDCCICPCPAHFYPYDDDFYNLDVCSEGSWDCGGGASALVGVGGSAKLYAWASFEDCNGTFVYSADVSSSYLTCWRSQNTGVATVDGSGNVTGTAEGSTTVTAEYNDCSDWNDWSGVCMCDTWYDGQGNATVTVIAGSVTVRLGPPPLVRSASFSLGDYLSFPPGGSCGATVLGAEGCSVGWFWQWEAVGSVSDDAANWLQTQDENSRTITTIYTNQTQSTTTTGYARDNPHSGLWQRTSGIANIYWLDSPGPYFSSNILSIDDQATKTGRICSTTTTQTYCVCVDWDYHLVGTANLTGTAALIDTNNSSASITRTSYICQPQR